MLKRAFLCAALATMVAAGPSTAQRAEHGSAPQVAAWANAEPADPVAPALLRDIIRWLSQNFDLPATDELPNIAFTTPERMDVLRYRGFLNRHEQSGAKSDTVAIYEAASTTIYLPEGWRGMTPAEVSVLVHEVVHHLQHTAKFPYACPREREKLAYQAQDRWLQQFDRTLAGEFGTDGFTLLVRTSCGF